jgi:FtsH-binding integral membrane protein
VIFHLDLIFKEILGICIWFLYSRKCLLCSNRNYYIAAGILAGVMGALLGWLVNRTRQATIASAIAGVAFVVGPGHNIPFFIGVGLASAGKMLLIMTAVIIVSGLTLGIAAN